jgi:hypothetical protein
MFISRILYYLHSSGHLSCFYIAIKIFASLLQPKLLVVGTDLLAGKYLAVSLRT